MARLKKWSLWSILGFSQAIFAGPKSKVIMDHAGSVDDFSALAMVALSDRVNLELVTIVPADSYKEAALRSTMGTLSLVGHAAPALASDHEGLNKFPEKWRKDASKFADLPELRPYLPATVPKASAVEELGRRLSGSGPHLILATGPLTNIAEVLGLHPELKKKIGRIYVMGGAIAGPGNVFIDNRAQGAEWNFYNDPAAAAKVLSSGVPVTLVPLDATDRLPVTHDFVRRLTAMRTSPVAQLFLNAWKIVAPQIQTEKYENTYFFWCSAAAAVLINPKLATIKRKRLRIITEGADQGRSVEDARGAKVDVVVGVDQKKLEDLMLSLFATRTEANNASYVDRMNVQYERTDEKTVVSGALSKLLGSRKFARALDVGPGPGEVTEPLARRTDKLTLIELNREYESRLKARFPNAEVIIDSIQNREFKGAFDAILLSQALYYVDEDKWFSFSRRLLSFLKPGGSLFIVMNSEEGDMNRLVRQTWSRHPGAKTYAFRPWSEFKEELAQLGRLTSERLQYHYNFETNEAMAILGSSILAISDSKMLDQLRPEIEEFAAGLPTAAGKLRMTVGAEILEITPR